MNAILGVAAIIFATVSMMTEVSALSCESLSWKSHDQYNALEKLQKYSNKMILYRTITPDWVCGIGSYQRLSSNGLYTLTFSDQCTYLSYEYSYIGGGVWGKTNLKSGIQQKRRIYAFADDNENFFAIFYTCDGARFESFDTYVTTKNIVPEAEKAFQKAKIVLENDQQWRVCKTLNEKPSY